MKNSSDTIGNRTRDLPTCNAVPQPTALPRAPELHIRLSELRVRVRKAPVAICDSSPLLYGCMGKLILFKIRCMCSSCRVLKAEHLLLCTNICFTIQRSICQQTRSCLHLSINHIYQCVIKSKIHTAIFLSNLCKGYVRLHIVKHCK